MATTAILRSQDSLLSLNTAFRHEPHPNPRTQPHLPRHQKRSPVGRHQGPDRTARFRAKNLVMGQVKILKRGEELRPPTPTESLVAGPMGRLGPEPETVQKQIRVTDSKLYAGSSVFLASPPPSSVPVPAFFARKNRDDAVSSEIRRLLRLDHLV